METFSLLRDQCLLYKSGFSIRGFNDRILLVNSSLPLPNRDESFTVTRQNAELRMKSVEGCANCHLKIKCNPQVSFLKEDNTIYPAVESYLE